MNNDNVPKNASKRLPIVFCLDVSPSMGWEEKGSKSSISLLNEAVNALLNNLNRATKTRAAAEVAFVTYSTTIIENTDFIPVKKLANKEFTAVNKGGTQTALAITKSIEKIENRKESLKDAQIGCYPPFLVLVTDGNPDRNDDANLEKRAIELVQSHMVSHGNEKNLIVPFFIGVGDRLLSENLTKYIDTFFDGIIKIKGKDTIAKDQFEKVFEFIFESVLCSIDLFGKTSDDSQNGSKKESAAVETIKAKYHDLLQDLL